MELRHLVKENVFISRWNVYWEENVNFYNDCIAIDYLLKDGNKLFGCNENNNFKDFDYNSKNFNNKNNCKDRNNLNSKNFNDNYNLNNKNFNDFNDNVESLKYRVNDPWCDGCTHFKEHTYSSLNNKILKLRINYRTVKQVIFSLTTKNDKIYINMYFMSKKHPLVMLDNRQDTIL